MSGVVLLGMLCGAAAAICWGCSDVVARHAAQTIRPVRAFWASSLTGMVILTLLLLPTGQFYRLGNVQAWGVLVLCLGGLLVAGNLLLFRAFAQGSLAVVSPIQASYNAIAAVLALIVGHEALNPVQATGLIVVFVGVVLLARQGEVTMCGTQEKPATCTVGISRIWRSTGQWFRKQRWSLFQTFVWRLTQLGPQPPPPPIPAMPVSGGPGGEATTTQTTCKCRSANGLWWMTLRVQLHWRVPTVLRGRSVWKVSGRSLPPGVVEALGAAVAFGCAYFGMRWVVPSVGAALTTWLVNMEALVLLSPVLISQMTGQWKHGRSVERARQLVFRSHALSTRSVPGMFITESRSRRRMQASATGAACCSAGLANARQQETIVWHRSNEIRNRPPGSGRFYAPPADSSVAGVIALPPDRRLMTANWRAMFDWGAVICIWLLFQLGYQSLLHVSLGRVPTCRISCWQELLRLSPLALIGVLDVAANVLFNTALASGATAIVAALAALQTPITVLLAVYLLRERVARGQWGALALTMGGLLLLVV